MNDQKKELCVQLYLYFDINTLSGEVNEVAKRIQSIPDRLKKENETVRKNPDLFHKYEIRCNQYYDDFIIDIYGWRYETDEELAKRMEAARKVQEARDKAAKTRKLRKQEREKLKESNEYKEYERLKAKFEKK